MQLVDPNGVPSVDVQGGQSRTASLREQPHCACEAVAVLSVGECRSSLSHPTVNINRCSVAKSREL